MLGLISIINANSAGPPCTTPRMSAASNNIGNLSFFLTVKLHRERGNNHIVEFLLNNNATIAQTRNNNGLIEQSPIDMAHSVTTRNMLEGIRSFDHYYDIVECLSENTKLICLSFEVNMLSSLMGGFSL